MSFLIVGHNSTWIPMLSLTSPSPDPHLLTLTLSPSLSNPHPLTLTLSPFYALLNDGLLLIREVRFYRCRLHGTKYLLSRRSRNLIKLIHSADSTVNAPSNEPNINSVVQKPTDLTMVGHWPTRPLGPSWPTWPMAGKQSWVLVPTQSSDMSPDERPQIPLANSWNNLTTGVLCGAVSFF